MHSDKYIFSCASSPRRLAVKLIKLERERAHYIKERERVYIYIYICTTMYYYVFHKGCFILRKEDTNSFGGQGSKLVPEVRGVLGSFRM